MSSLDRLFVSLRTERLTLEPIRQDHAAEMHRILNDARLYRYMASEIPPSLRWLQDRYRALESGWSPDHAECWLNWIVVRDGTPIGYVQATIPAGDDYATLGWSIGSRWQGHGFAREAVRAMCAHLLAAGIGELRATIDARNSRSSALAERVGFRRVRSRPSDEILDGVRWEDADYVLRSPPP